MRRNEKNPLLRSEHKLMDEPLALSPRVRFMLILRAVCYVIGLGLLIFTLYYNSYATQFQSWETTRAELHAVSGFRVSREIAASENESNYGHVSFSFSVDGKRYIGYRVMPLQDVFLPTEKVIGLTPGHIRISYNPEKPEESFIFADKPTDQMKILALIGMLLVFIGYFVPPMLSRMVDYVMHPPTRVDADYMD